MFEYVLKLYPIIHVNTYQLNYTSQLNYSCKCNSVTVSDKKRLLITYVNIQTQLNLTQIQKQTFQVLICLGLSIVDDIQTKLKLHRNVKKQRGMLLDFQEGVHPQSKEVWIC